MALNLSTGQLINWYGKYFPLKYDKFLKVKIWINKKFLFFKFNNKLEKSSKL